MFEKYFNRELHPLGYMHRLDRSLSIMTLVRAGGSLYCACVECRELSGQARARRSPGPGTPGL